MRIVFIGPPGAGKGTQSARLVAHLGIPHISTGEVLRAAREEGSELGMAVAEYLNDGRLVPDATIMKMVAQRLSQPDCADGWLLDGCPRTISQAETLLESLAEHGEALDLVLELKVDEEELYRRLLLRRRSDDSPETVRGRLRVFLAQTAPVLEFFRERGTLVSIVGTGTPDDVFARIKTALDRVRARSENAP